MFQAYLIRLDTIQKSKQTQVAPSVPRWHHDSATLLRHVRQCMGLMTSRLWIFRARLICWSFVVPKLIPLFTADGWSAQPYSINFGLQQVSIQRIFENVLTWYPKMVGAQIVVAARIEHFYEVSKNNKSCSMSIAAEMYIRRQTLP